MEDQNLKDQAQIDAYQEILNKYANELQPSPTPEKPPASPQPTLESIQDQKPLAPIAPPTPPMEPKLPPLPPKPPESLNPPKMPKSPMVAMLPDKVHPVVTLATGFFKITALLSFLLFLAITVKVIYNLYQLQSVNTDYSKVLNVTQPPIASPTEAVATGQCTMDSKTYQIGDSFPSTDGCNTCSCVTDENIVCTEKACANAPATKPTTAPVVTCEFNNKKYKVGQSYKDSCNTCLCNADGQSLCTTLVCN